MYKEFYLQHFNGRCFAYNTYLGNAELKVKIGSEVKKEYILIVHTLQMVVLMLFNNYKSLTITDIIDMTKIPYDDTIKTIKTLLLIKILHIINNNNNNFNDNSQLFINHAFYSKF